MENKTQGKKFERTTQEQLQFYVAFCKQHPELQRGKNSPNAPHCIQELWDKLASSLNGMRGPTRSASKWKETMGQWKKQLRSRARKAKFERARTGGGPMEEEAIGEFEHQALQTFGIAAVEGVPGVMAIGFQKDPRSASAEAVEIGDEVSFKENIFADISQEALPQVNDFEETSSPIPSTSHNMEELRNASNHAPNPSAARQGGPKSIIKMMLESIKKREEQENRAYEQQERAIEQQKLMTEAFLKMSHALSLLCEKLDIIKK